MPRSYRLHGIALAAAVALALSGCGADGPAPAITEVRPAPVAPGGLLLLSGQGLDRVAGASLDGRPLTSLTVVNDGLLAVVTPEDVPAGSRSIELRTFEGERVATLVDVRAVAGSVSSHQPAPDPAPAPAPPAPPPPPAPGIVPPVPPARQAPPPAPAGRGDDDDDEDDKKKEKQKKPDTKPDNGRGRDR